MSIALVVTAGFGNGTLSGTVKGVVLRGYSISDFIATYGPGFGANSSITNNGLGYSGLINNYGLGENGLIVLGFGSNATMTNYGIGKAGLINNDGIGENGEI